MENKQDIIKILFTAAALTYITYIGLFALAIIISAVILFSVAKN
jgi:hypothetical protein